MEEAFQRKEDEEEEQQGPGQEKVALVSKEPDVRVM